MTKPSVPSTRDLSRSSGVRSRYGSCESGSGLRATTKVMDPRSNA
jgi:hypothetical protein